MPSPTSHATERGVPHAGATCRRARTTRSAAMPARSPAASLPSRRGAWSTRVSRTEAQGRAHRHHGRRSATRPSPGQAVTLVLDREIDVSRGDVLAVAPPPDTGRSDHRPGGVDGRDAAVPRPRLSVHARLRAAVIGTDHRDHQPARRRYACTRSRCASCDLNEIGRVTHFAGAAGRRASPTRPAASWAASS